MRQNLEEEDWVKVLISKWSEERKDALEVAEDPVTGPVYGAECRGRANAFARCIADLKRHGL